MGFTVTPWDVKGEVDYNRLIKEFGVEKIDIDNDPLIKEGKILHKNLLNNYKLLSQYKKNIPDLIKKYRLSKETTKLILNKIKTRLNDYE